MTDVRLSATLKLDGFETIAPAISPAQDPIRGGFRYNAWNVVDIIHDQTAANGLDLDVAPVDLSHTLSGATGTEDLTAAPLARDINQTINLDSKKLAAILLYAPATNTAAITVAEGATNGFPILGAGCSVTLAPGDRVARLIENDSAAGQQIVDSTHKILDISGTSGDKVNIIAYFVTPAGM